MLAKYFLVAAAAVVGSMAAEKCDAQAQFDLCKKNMQTTVDACGKQDYHCLCEANKVILNNCYPLCPQDSGKGSQESIVSSWCVSAGGESSSAPAPVSTATVTGSSTAVSAPVPSSTSTATDTPKTDKNSTTTTTTTGSSKPTGNAGNMLAPAGFVVAAAAVAGLVL